MVVVVVVVGGRPGHCSVPESGRPGSWPRCPGAAPMVERRQAMYLVLMCWQSQTVAACPMFHGECRKGMAPRPLSNGTGVQAGPGKWVDGWGG